MNPFHIDKLRHIIVECLKKNGRQLRSRMIGLFKNLPGGLKLEEKTNIGLFGFQSSASEGNMIWLFPKIVKHPQIHSNRVFQYKPSILGYSYFWKHPYATTIKNNTLGIPRRDTPLCLKGIPMFFFPKKKITC